MKLCIIYSYCSGALFYSTRNICVQCTFRGRFRASTYCTYYNKYIVLYVHGEQDNEKKKSVTKKAVNIIPV